ncbi:hypothetical protein FHR76_004658 [Rhizobium sp. RAS22]|nr:hypothetical protein BLX90_24030 [Rhizobium sp. Y9]MBB2908243.1 hypothetical protein [Rhizobium sp. RAS22]
MGHAQRPGWGKSARSAQRKTAGFDNGTRHAKAAPFRRNDEMLSVMPAGLIVFLGNGITGNLADKARRLGIPVWQASGDGA